MEVVQKRQFIATYTSHKNLVISTMILTLDCVMQALISSQVCFTTIS